MAAFKKRYDIVNAQAPRRPSPFRLARQRPVPISGLDSLLINQIFFYEDPVRFTAQINSLCDELELRVKNEAGVAERGNTAHPDLGLPHGGAELEAAGDHRVVGSGHCRRGVLHRRARNAEPGGQQQRTTLDGLMDALVDRYLKIDCAIFSPNAERLDHIREMAANTGPTA